MYKSMHKPWRSFIGGHKYSFTFAKNVDPQVRTSFSWCHIPYFLSFIGDSISSVLMNIYAIPAVLISNRDKHFEGI